MKIGNLVAATATALVAPALVGVQAANVARQRNRRRYDAARDAWVAVPAPTPPRVALHGFCHLDVVRDLARGWIGTVHHGKLLGEATVRWHGSFASDALGDVAARLALVQRRR